MNIKVYKDRTTLQLDSDVYGTQNENNVTVLKIEVPEEYENWNKRIVFLTDDGNFWDYIEDNTYTIKNNITKYKSVKAYIWLTENTESTEESVGDFRSKIFTLSFSENENADDIVADEEQIDGFNTMLTVLNAQIETVTQINTDFTQLKEEVEQAETARNTAETERQTAEETRQTAEEERVQNETERIQNEIARQENIDKLLIDTGWQDFTWVNDTFINDTYSHYSSNKWRVKSDILFISIGVGNSSGSLDTSIEQEIARIPITGNESFATSNTRIWTGAVGEAGAYAGFMIRQLTDYISVYLKPHMSTRGQVGVWYSGHFAVPLDDTSIINEEIAVNTETTEEVQTTETEDTAEMEVEE